ncbi:MAG: glutamate synthase subunit alpha, partial [Propionibacteriaceae bacterium]|nr:glutamate synthase subunit alpha [Propionibacteriaceae bacterium]
LQNTTGQDHGLDESLDRTELIPLAQPALERGERVVAEVGVRNIHRTVGTILGHEVTKATRGAGFDDDTIDITLRGSAGQSFGAFVPRGVTLRLIGDSNDYVGKGLSGGRIVVTTPEGVAYAPREQIIAGNVIGYGATSGEIFLRGQVGERFCVRNSGATAVVEGIGDHGCEYMTGGLVLVLGGTGRNFAAGMSGGVAYVRDLKPENLNTEMVDVVALGEADVAEISDLLTRYARETGSTLAEELLAGDIAGMFSKVLPREYAKVLAAKTDAERQGLDADETNRRMMAAVTA